MTQYRQRVALAALGILPIVQESDAYEVRRVGPTNDYRSRLLRNLLMYYLPFDGEIESDHSVSAPIVDGVFHIQVPKGWNR